MRGRILPGGDWSGEHAEFSGPLRDMNKIKQSLPAVALIAILLAAWWLIVVETHSVIFPTPWQVVTGTIELIKDGTLWRHIGASLMRVGVGFSLGGVFGVPLAL